MRGHEAHEDQLFPVEPWCVRETTFDMDRLAQTETALALSNGHIGLRANLDEGEPYGIPGSYLNSFFEQRPLPYAEVGYGYPEDGQTVVNVTNGKLIRLLVEDEPFDMRYGEVHAHERTLNLRAAELLGVEPAQCAVFEDALAGAEAGRAGRFGCVVGVDRVGQAQALRDRGGDPVVQDLAELL